MNDLLILFAFFVIYIIGKTIFKGLSKIAEMQGYTPSQGQKTRTRHQNHESSTRSHPHAQPGHQGGTAQHPGAPQNLFEFFQEIKKELKWTDVSKESDIHLPYKPVQHKKTPLSRMGYNKQTVSVMPEIKVHTPPVDRHLPVEKKETHAIPSILKEEGLFNVHDKSDIQRGIILSEILRPPLTRRNLFLPPYLRG